MEKQITRRELFRNFRDLLLGNFFGFLGLSAIKEVSFRREILELIALQTGRRIKEADWQRSLSDIIKTEKRGYFPAEEIIRMLRRQKDSYPRLAFVSVGQEQPFPIGALGAILPSDNAGGKEVLVSPLRGGVTKDAFSIVEEPEFVTSKELRSIPVNQLSSAVVVNPATIVEGSTNKPFLPGNQLMFNWEVSGLGSLGVLRLKRGENGWPWQVGLMGDRMSKLISQFLSQESVSPKIYYDKESVGDASSGIVVQRLGVEGESRILGVGLGDERGYSFLRFKKASDKIIQPADDTGFFGPEEFLVKMAISPNYDSAGMLSLTSIGLGENLLNFIDDPGDEPIAQKVIRSGPQSVKQVFMKQRDEIVFTVN